MSGDHPTTPVEYRDIPGRVGYRIGSDGSAWSRIRLGGSGGLCDTWRRLKSSPNCVSGHHYVGFGKSDKKTVHRLVAEAFLGPCPAGMECRHLNGDPSDNRVENLAWGTRAENVADMRRHGTWNAGAKRGARNPSTKHTEAQVAEIRRLRRETTLSNKQIAELTGTTRSRVKEILLYRAWLYIP